MQKFNINNKWIWTYEKKRQKIIVKTRKAATCINATKQKLNMKLKQINVNIKMLKRYSCR